MSNETDGFTSGGRAEGRFPSVFADSQIVGEFSQWEQHHLEERYNDYSEYLGREDISPRSRGEAERVMGHLIFELSWREGIYGETA